METFKNLPEEKRNIILNAAYTCFARNGYQKTSIADIAAMAHISKSSIFHYFGSKKNLYLYLYEFSIDVITNAVFKGIKKVTDDFFERIRQAQIIKMKIMAQYIDMFDFLIACIKENVPELAKEIKQCNQPYIKKGFDALFEGINWEKFKPGVNATMVINAVTWVSEGYIRSTIGQKSIEEMSQEAFEYVNLLKTTFYKEEYL
ncbi:TetR/AcrR family transcriptional regulator [Proteiniborus sp. MB09-C3]|uniref:TetR/AcrR family transcriptional regulator n=1 Tax=Proteiniborus sp. MB09-C3 TaxID=3050072 RepID=UPI0025565BDB|nr:TetR/AcrR family transcriptional regulator [Proteiniborus sp. MB09-C3]WIV13323.1 TetR/AcrR family transcriptional regulator [Proteiniborus sp. MB09-C3]